MARSPCPSAPQPLSSVTVLGACVAGAFTEPVRSSSDGLALRALPCAGRANTAVALAWLGIRTRPLPRAPLQGFFGILFRACPTASGVDPTRPHTFYAGSAANWQWTEEELAATGRESAACTPAPRHSIRQPGGTRIEDHLAKAREQVTVFVDPEHPPLLAPAATPCDLPQSGAGRTAPGTP